MRKLILDMENGLGLSELSEAQRLTIAAAADLKSDQGYINTSALRQHPLTHNLSRPTYFRALQLLEEAGYLIRPPNVKRGTYILKIDGRQLFP